MNHDINAGGRVKIGEREGEVFRITPLPNGSKEYRIAFDEASPQSFIYPPQVVEKVFSPIERPKREDFDPSVNFDLPSSQQARLSVRVVQLSRALRVGAPVKSRDFLFAYGL